MKHYTSFELCNTHLLFITNRFHWWTVKQEQQSSIMSDNKGICKFSYSFSSVLCSKAFKFPLFLPLGYLRYLYPFDLLSCRRKTWNWIQRNRNSQQLIRDELNTNSSSSRKRPECITHFKDFVLEVSFILTSILLDLNLITPWTNMRMMLISNLKLRMDGEQGGYKVAHTLMCPSHTLLGWVNQAFPTTTKGSDKCHQQLTTHNFTPKTD